MSVFTVTTYGPAEFLCRIGLLPGTLDVRPQRILIADVQRGVARHYGLPPTAMTDEQKGRAFARPRQTAMYLAHKLTGRSLAEIGRRFHRDHTTVIHALRQVRARIEADALFAAEVRQIEREIRG